MAVEYITTENGMNLTHKMWSQIYLCRKNPV